MTNSDKQPNVHNNFSNDNVKYVTFYKVQSFMKRKNGKDLMTELDSVTGR